MNEIEKIKKYIERTGVKYKNGTPYQMNTKEMFALAHMTKKEGAV